MLSDAEINAVLLPFDRDSSFDDIARNILAAHQAKLLAGVEMPEPTIITDMDWCENEVYDIGDIQRYAAAAAAQARVKALSEAKVACHNLGLSQEIAQAADVCWDCAAAIDRLNGGE